MIYLITGKAGAGKTHYAKNLVKEFQQDSFNKLVVWIDGDIFRKTNKNDDFSDEGRINNLMEAARVAKDYENSGYTVVMSFVAPKREWREMMRDHFKKSFLIYIPGGTLWKDTTYEIPDETELKMKG